MTLHVSTEMSTRRRSWKAPIERFFDHVLVGDGCWEWKGGKAKGYGKIEIGGVSRYAHRLSFELFNGECAAELDVLHDCDNPSCVRPAHLKLGTHAQNMADASKRKRLNPARGAASPRAKITEEQARAIRASSESSTTLGPRHGVTPSMVRKIRAGKVWRHLT